MCIPARAGGDRGALGPTVRQPSRLTVQQTGPSTARKVVPALSTLADLNGGMSPCARRPAGRPLSALMPTGRRSRQRRFASGRSRGSRSTSSAE
jgi:hypothetical protein